MTTFGFANSDATATLNVALNSSATSIAVLLSGNWPATGTVPVLIDSEIIWVTAPSNTSPWTIARGQENTVAAAHGAGAVAYAIPTAAALNSITGTGVATTSTFGTVEVDNNSGGTPIAITLSGYLTSITSLTSSNLSASAGIPASKLSLTAAATAGHPTLPIGTGTFGGGVAPDFQGTAAVGINMATGFSGNLIDSQVAGVSRFSVQASTVGGPSTTITLPTTGGSSINFGNAVILGYSFSSGQYFIEAAAGDVAIRGNSGNALRLGSIGSNGPNSTLRLTNDQMTVAATLTTAVPLTVLGFAAQTADLQIWQNSTPTTLAGVRIDGLLYATGTGTTTTQAGVATRQKAGAPADADWSVAPPNGTIVVDSTNNKLWARVAGVWKGVVIA